MIHKELHSHFVLCHPIAACSLFTVIWSFDSIIFYFLGFITVQWAGCLPVSGLHSPNHHVRVCYLSWVIETLDTSTLALEPKISIEPSGMAGSCGSNALTSFSCPLPICPTSSLSSADHKRVLDFSPKSAHALPLLLLVHRPSSVTMRHSCSMAVVVVVPRDRSGRMSAWNFEIMICKLSHNS